MITRTSPTTPAAGLRKSTLLASASIAAFWVGLLGPAWAHLPAQPKLRLPSAEANFAAIADVAATQPASLQTAFFGWLAWTFAALSAVLAILLIRWCTRSICALCVAAGIIQFIVVTIAFEKTFTWSLVHDARLGLVLYSLGTVLIIIAGIVGLKQHPRVEVNHRGSE